MLSLYDSIKTITELKNKLESIKTYQDFLMNNRIYMIRWTSDFGNLINIKKSNNDILLKNLAELILNDINSIRIMRKCKKINKKVHTMIVSSYYNEPSINMLNLLIEILSNEIKKIAPNLNNLCYKI
jgi:hypothetical protein